MFAKCCNPECEKPFDHREGRLVRFSKAPSTGRPVGNQPRIEHYWLCGDCADVFVFEYDSEMNVAIKPRKSEAVESRHSYSIAIA
jgi:hypothetical protein